jgi:hypothetical protein
MRILVIGFPLPNPQIDNYSFIQAPSFFDYDAVVVETGSVSKVIEEVLTRTEEHHTFANEPVLNEPSGPFVVGLADHLQRRRIETERLLAAGKMLIVFVRPNVPHTHILGFPGYDRYAWLPAPSGVYYRPPQLLPADGRGVGLVDRTHPLADLVERFQNWFTYRAWFSEQLPAFPESGRVLMRSPGGAAIGIELKVGPGRIVLLPALEDLPSGDPRFELASKLVEAVKRTIAGETEADAPRWVRDFSLPGLDELESEEAAARRAVADAEERLTAATANAADLAGLRRLLWSEGQYGIGPAVRSAFRRLAFTVDQDVDRAAVMYADGRTALFEVEGDRERVGEQVVVRLQRRLEQELLTTGDAKKGILVVNGKRRTAPDARTEPYATTLRIAAEAYRYALVTGPQLFELVRMTLADTTGDEARRIREALWKTEGEFDLEALRPQVDDVTELDAGAEVGEEAVAGQVDADGNPQSTP